MKLTYMAQLLKQMTGARRWRWLLRWIHNKTANWRLFYVKWYSGI